MMHAHSVRTLLGIAAGLAVAGVWVASEAHAQAPPSGGCYYPLDAVEEYLNFMEPRLDPPQLSSDPNICTTQCAAIRTGCTGVLQASYDCKHSVQFGTATWDKAACREVEETDRPQCFEVLRQNHANFQEFLDDSRTEGRALCETRYGDCMTFCR